LLTRTWSCQTITDHAIVSEPCSIIIIIVARFVDFRQSFTSTAARLIGVTVNGLIVELDLLNSDNYVRVCVE